MPSPGLLPPKKLLSPPFTEDRLLFLSVLSDGLHEIENTDAAYVETANDGLMAAVQRSNVEAAAIFFRMGLKRSTELLRIAVESGCEDRLVRLVLGSSDVDANEVDDVIDLLDPALWKWAENARAHGNSRGTWLMELLRDAQRRREQPPE